MAVEGIHTQIPREAPIQPRLENPEIIEKLRHGNILDVLRSQISTEDFNKFISYRGRLFENSILQNYQVYADAGTVPAPDLAVDFVPHQAEMSMGSGDREFLRQEMASLARMRMAREDGRVRFSAQVGDFPASTEGTAPGEDVMAIAEEALQDWETFFGELMERVEWNQVLMQLKSVEEEQNREIQRIMSLVAAGVADAEYVFLAATKSVARQNGILFSYKGKKVSRLNEQMDRIARDLPMDPNVRELHMAQSQTRGAQSQLQLEMMDLQKYAQNVAGALDFAITGIKTIGQAKQALISAIRPGGP